SSSTIVDILNHFSLIGLFFFFQAEDGIRDGHVTGVQTCALPISVAPPSRSVLPATVRARLARICVSTCGLSDLAANLVQQREAERDAADGEALVSRAGQLGNEREDGEHGPHDHEDRIGVLSKGHGTLPPAHRPRRSERLSVRLALRAKRPSRRRLPARPAAPLSPVT